MMNSSVEAALDSMLKAGANGVVVLVCHAYSQGILLPLATGGGALAVASNMNIVDDVINAEAEAASIRKMPTKSDAELKAVLDRWEKFLNRLQPWLDHRKFHDQRSRSLLLQMAGNGSGKAGILREPAHTRVAPLHRPSAEIMRQQTFQARIARLQHRQGERHDGDS